MVSRPAIRVDGLKPASREAPDGISRPYLRSPFRSTPPRVSGTCVPVFGEQFDRRELGGFVLEHLVGGDVPDEDLHGGHERGDREPHGQAEAVVVVAAAAQHAGGVDAGHDEPRHHVGGEQHVQGFIPEGPVEEHAERVHVDDAAAAEGEPAGSVHPAVGRDHRQRPADAGQRDRDSAPEVRPRAHPVPTVDVDGDEDRLNEEEQALDGEGDAVRGAEPAHQPWPQQTQLEREDRARDGADREEHRRHVRPPPGEQHRVLVAPAQPQVVRDKHEDGEGHPEGHEDDVKPQGEGHLLARRQQLRRVRCRGKGTDGPAREPDRGQ